MSAISESTSLSEVLARYPKAREVLDRYGLQGCGGENGSAESLGFFARVHQIDLKQLLRELNAQAAEAKTAPSEYHETLRDYIYRRFFKAGIAILLTIGGLWGVVNLLQIEFAKSLLLPQLLTAIHAHAHAMVFGWVGLFVMGFAYQSFPRFKHTSLWRPGLANLSFYLMLIGIGARVVAEMSRQREWVLAFGVISASAELVAIAIFLVVIFQTSRQAIRQPNAYEKFIFAALIWFFIQAAVSALFFFATATATSAAQLVYRIALLDGPLRDIQFLGFAAMMIAGVSLRFIPLVYNLRTPARDLRNVIFILMNASLLLEVGSYVGLFLNGNPVYASGLGLSYLLIFAWAVLLVWQLGIFTKAAEPDRSWKFIRAAYSWLLIATAMLPLSILYLKWTGQTFSHAYAGAQLHALTVGFVSLMIVGVASRVVPTLSGVDSKRISSLWGPFILLNVGCIGRVSLQILTDFQPRLAFSLIGVTGVLELAGFLWWGVGLWRTMNLAKVHRAGLLRAPVPLAAK